MGQPDLAAPPGAIRPHDDPLVAVLHAAVAATDAASVLTAAVDALADRMAVAWIAADPDHDGQLEVIAASGVRMGVIARVAGSVAAGEGPWRDACAAAGLTLSVWQPLGAASVPAAFLGAAANAESAAAFPGPAAAEMAQLIGAMLDAQAHRLAAERPLASTGRLDWLEATRRASRSVRHDLANVLTGVSFYGSQLVADLAPGTASAEDAAAIGDVVARGSDLLELLHQLSRDPAESEVVPLDPSAVVDAIAPVLRAVAEPCALEVGQLSSMVVRASRRMLEEALLALVVDARGSAAGVGATISLVVSVAPLAPDNGLGLAGGTYAAVTVGVMTPLREGAAEHAARQPLAARDSIGAADVAAAPTETLTDTGPSASDSASLLAATRPGEPGRGVALASLAACAVGGGLWVERSPVGVTRATILLPQAVSRRRSTPAADRASADG